MVGVPWGKTLAMLAHGKRTEQLTLDAAGKRYCIAFDRGAIVGASSPHASDTALRIALSHQVVTPSQAPELLKRITAAPDRDEVELIAIGANLAIDQAELLRRHVIAQRAARTFSVVDGLSTVGDRIRVPVVPGIAVDTAAVVYLGARLHMADDRLARELRDLGTHFTLKAGASDALAAFGFTAIERPLLQALRSGATVPELEATLREIDPRMLHAAIYALATCDALACVTVARALTPPNLHRSRPPTTPDAGRAPTERSIAIARTGSGPRFARAPTPLEPIITRAPARASTGPLDAEHARMLAEQAFARGTRALHSEHPELAAPELARAVELAPTEVDYVAALAWAKFCLAPDKVAAAAEARRALERAIYKSARPAMALFHLGRVERMIGRDREALRHFQEVLALQPTNDAAASEVRVLEARLSKDARR